MFRKRETPAPPAVQPTRPIERVTSVLGSGVNWKGNLSGSGGVRIEGAFEGDITLRGLLVVGETGRVTCQDLRANTVVVAGAVRGDITAQKVEIRATGRVWGNVTTAAFATEEGAFLRGQIRMEEQVEIELSVQAEPASEAPSEPVVSATADTQPVAAQPEEENSSEAETAPVKLDPAPAE